MTLPPQLELEALRLTRDIREAARRDWPDQAEETQIRYGDVVNLLSLEFWVSALGKPTRHLGFHFKRNERDEFVGAAAALIRLVLSRWLAGHQRLDEELVPMLRVALSSTRGRGETLSILPAPIEDAIAQEEAETQKQNVRDWKRRLIAPGEAATGDRE